MAQSAKEQFEAQWKTFVVHLTAQIRQRSQDRLPSVEKMNMLLKDGALDWVSDMTACGRWLTGYEKTEPGKAELIRKILLEDMRFKPCAPKAGLPKAAQIAVPAVGFAAGLLISRCLKAGLIIQAVSALAPAALLAPAMKALDDQLRRKNTEEGMKEYLDQLQLYYRSIIGILETE